MNGLAKEDLPLPSLRIGCGHSTCKMPELPMDFPVTFRCLAFREDDQWCALALELSLRAYGDSEKEAIDALQEAVDTHVAFAAERRNLDGIWCPVEERYFQLFEKALRQQLAQAMVPERKRVLDVVAGSVPLLRGTNQNALSMA